MKATIPVMIQDQFVTFGKGMASPVQKINVEADFFLNGPVTEKVAILDFDENGELCPGVHFVPSEIPGGPGHYTGLSSSTPDIHSASFIQASVLGTVLNTIRMFEEEDTLGRPITWGFNAPQLLVVPRAGKWANAYYERDSHSLQFFYFPSQRQEYEGKEVFTCLSHDIIAHETGHAILDGIAPDLYSAITPQSLALHEAVADLTALIISFRSKPLREAVLKQTKGKICNSTAFSSIAEEFGLQKEGSGPVRPLRSLLNNKKMPESGFRRFSPHQLSEVLSGAFYTVMVKMHEYRKEERIEKRNFEPQKAAEQGLFIAGEILKRMVFRGLDYLPPGEISFADYARAIIASDKAAHPLTTREREWICKEFVERGIVPDENALDVTPDEKKVKDLNEALADIDMETLRDSDWTAYNFANRFYTHLGIPDGVPLWVRPRLDVKKKYIVHGGKIKHIRECIFKVSWDMEEDNPQSRGLPRKRQVTAGAMLAIDWNNKKIRSLLTTDASTQMRTDRSEMIKKLYNEGRLKVGNDAIGPDGNPLHSVVSAELAGKELMRVRDSARMLHIEGLYEDEESEDE